MDPIQQFKYDLRRFGRPERGQRGRHRGPGRVRLGLRRMARTGLVLIVAAMLFLRPLSPGDPQ
jgi:hypothetical protein